LVVVDVDLDLVTGQINSDSLLPKEDSLNLRKQIRKILKPEFFKLDNSFPHYSSFKGKNKINIIKLINKANQTK